MFIVFGLLIREPRLILSSEYDSTKFWSKCWERTSANEKTVNFVSNVFQINKPHQSEPESNPLFSELFTALKQIL